MTQGRVRRLTPWLVLATAAPVACEPGPGPPPEPVVRDSAGVTIVENADPDPAARLSWSVGPEPVVDIGRLDGDEAYQLFRAMHALRLDDGRIVVADGGSGEIRVFDANGAHLDTWGGPGEGPGEFTFPARIGVWPGDSLAVWDRRLRRLSVLAPDGTFGRAVDVTQAGQGGLLEWVGAFPDGTSVFSHQDIMGEAPADGMRRNPATAVLLDPAGEQVAVLPEQPGDEVLMRVGDGSIDVLRIPFAKGFVAARVGDRVALGPNDRFELRLHGRTGALERIVRLDAALQPVTDADIEAEIERQVEAVPEQVRAGLRAANESAPRVATFPAIDHVIADPGGHIWMRTYHAPAEDHRPAVWGVLDAEGAFLGRIETPAGLTVVQIGRDFLLGHRTDDLGIEHIQMWTLTRGPS